MLQRNTYLDAQLTHSRGGNEITSPKCNICSELLSENTGKSSMMMRWNVVLETDRRVMEHIVINRSDDRGVTSAGCTGT